MFGKTYFAGVFGGISGEVKNLGILDIKIAGKEDHCSKIIAGGLVGVIVGDGKVTNCFTKGEIRGVESAGGVVGVMGDEGKNSLIDSYSTVTISGSERVGGVVGGVLGKGIVSNCYSTGVISGGNNVGGVVGEAGGGTRVINSYFSGTINTGGSGRGNVGGVVGSASCDSVKRCYFSGTINANTLDNVGGIVGDVGGSLKISNCYSAGTIKGNNFVGGIAGKTDDYPRLSLKNSYSVSVVNGNNNVGGIIGYVSSRKAMAVEGCAALNPSVLARATSDVWVGRVASNYGDKMAKDIWGETKGPVLSNNVAIAKMTVKRNTVDKVFTKGQDEFDGADITIEQLCADGTIGGRFTADNGWVTEDGKLPGFGAALNLPAHLK